MYDKLLKPQKIILNNPVYKTNLLNFIDIVLRNSE